MVDQSVQEYLTEYLELHPDVLDSILSKSLNALKVSFSKIFIFVLFLFASICIKPVNQYVPVLACRVSICVEPEPLSLFLLFSYLGSFGSKEGKGVGETEECVENIISSRKTG